MKKNNFRGFTFLLFFLLFSKIIFAQIGETPANPFIIGALPYTYSGTTVGNVNDVNVSSPFDDGPDEFLKFCPTVTGPVYFTVTFPFDGINPVYPSVFLYSPSVSAVNMLAQGFVTGDNAGTVGLNYTLTAGTCYYLQIDNATSLSPSNGFSYTFSATSTIPAYPVLPTQPACTNIGFENGDISGWGASWGHTITTSVSPAPTPNYYPMYFTSNMGHHNITSGGNDPVAGIISQVCPLIAGNTKSIRLGDGPNASWGGASLEQKFSITSSNALFTYYYAVIMQDAGTDHTNQEQPFFKVDVKDCSGNPIVCGNYLVTGGPGIPGFTLIDATNNIYAKNWTPVLLDLTPYIGSCVSVQFTVGDCSKGAHYAYAYLDATCGPIAIQGNTMLCQNVPSILVAPPGAATYSWVNTANPGTVISTNDTLQVPVTTNGSATYQCNLTSVNGCNSSSTAPITVQAGVTITVTNPPPVCSPSSVDITAASIVTITSGSGNLTYWMDAACTIPITTPSAIATSGTYYIKITNPTTGCFNIQPVTVTINTTPVVNVTTADQSICIGSSLNLNSTLTPSSTIVPVTFTNTTDLPIPDGGSQVSSNITVSGINPQTVGVLPIVSVHVNFTHTWDADLDIYLKCPDGTLIQLSTGNGGSGDNYTNTYFVPTGTSITVGTAPFTGNFSPEQAFSLLNACTINGVWSLVVGDNTAGDSGTLLDWAITFNNYTPGPTFVWSPTTAMTNSTTLTPTVAPTVYTSYTLTGTSPSGGCTASDIINITVVPLPTVNAGTDQSLCAGGNVVLAGTIGGSATSATWSASSGSFSSATDLAATYTPTITSGTVTLTLTTNAPAPCGSVNDQVVITLNPLPIITGTLNVCIGSTTQLTGSASPSATTPWSSSNTVVATISNTGLVTGLSGGTTTITYTNTNGCIITALVIVNPLPTIAGTLNVCVGSTTQLTGSASPSATTPWSSSNTAVATISNTGLVSGLTGGTTTITYTNTNGCIITAIVTVNPLPTITGTLSLCIGSTTQLTGSASPSATAPWSSSNTAVATISNTGLVGGLTAGNTTITYTNVNGCIITAFVTVNPLPTISGTLNVCIGSTTQLTGSASPSATTPWSSSNTAVATISNTGLVSGLSGGTTTITYTNTNGCIITALVTVNPLPTIAGTLNVCVGSTTQLTGSASPSATTPWSSSNTAVATISNTGLVSGLTAGTTTITYTNANGCIITAIITVNPLPIVTASNNSPICATQDLNFTSLPAGATSYNWTGPNAFTSAQQNPTIIAATVAAAGAYTVVVTDNNGCANTGQTTVIINTSIVATASSNSPICEGQNINLNVLPAGATYSWTGPNGFLSSSQTPTITGATPIANGTYSVTATLPTGCTGTSSIAVVVNPLPITAVTSPSVCQGVTANLTASGATSYTWTAGATSNGINTATANPTVTTTYTVTGTSLGCSSTAVATVSVNPIPVSNAGPDILLCTGDPGSIGITTISGYSYSWMPVTGLSNSTVSDPTVTLTNTGVGTSTTTYTVTTTNASTGCASTDNVNVLVDPVQTANAGSLQPLCFGSSVTLSGSVGGSATGGTWSGGSGSFSPNANTLNAVYTPSMADTIGGSVILTLTSNSTGACPFASSNVTLTFYSIPIVNFNVDYPDGCPTHCVQFTDLSSVGGGDYIVSYNWSFGDGSGSILQNPAHCYSLSGYYNVTLTVTSNHNCQNTYTITQMVHVYDVPDAQFDYSPKPTSILEPTITFINQSSTDVIYWNWHFGDGDSIAPNIINPVHTYPNEVASDYLATLIVYNGYCYDTVSHEIIVGPEFTFFIPNAFTPNGDGVNDFFFGTGIGIVKYDIYIFDRWGNMIYHGDNIDTSKWDGRANGGADVAQQDVYVWKVKLTDVFGKKHNYIGTVTLVK